MSFSRVLRRLLPSPFVSQSHRRHLSVETGADSLTLKKDGRSYEFLYQWLRDHCRKRSPIVYNHATHQRSISLLEFSPDIKPAECLVKDERLEVKWSDEHLSQYEVGWLLSHHCEDRAEAFRLKSRPRTWEAAGLPWADGGTPSEEYLGSEEGLRKAVRSILVNGFAVVTGAEPTLAGTKRTVERMAPPAMTVYGEYYDLTSTHNSEATDSSYSNVALGCHTDTTYYTEAYGLQVFHATRAADKGGETLMIDGFRVAELLANEHPETYSFLCSFPLEAEYIHTERGRGRNFLAVDPVFKRHPVSGELEQFRYNVYDRAVHRMTAEEQREFYKHYRILADILENREELRARVLLQPGSVLLLNNWRVMHGRTGFEGARSMTGCYVSRTDFMSAARLLDLL